MQVSLSNPVHHALHAKPVEEVALSEPQDGQIIFALRHFVRCHEEKGLHLHDPIAGVFAICV